MTLNTEELNLWLGEDPVREELMMKEAPVSKTTLLMARRGYQPHERTAKAIREVMSRFPQGQPGGQKSFGT